MMRTYEVRGGEPVPSPPDCSAMTAEQAAARRRDIQALTPTLKHDPSARSQLLLELRAVEAREAALRAQAVENRRIRNFAGLGGPLHEALIERFSSDDVVAVIEARAVEIQLAREKAAADRRAAKEAAKAGSHGGRDRGKVAPGTETTKASGTRR